MYYQSHEEGFFEVIEQRLRFYQCKGKVGIVGDLNARCGERLDIIQDMDRFHKFMFTADNDDTGPYDDIPMRFSMDNCVNSSGAKLLDICLRSGFYKL